MPSRTRSSLARRAPWSGTLLSQLPRAGLESKRSFSVATPSRPRPASLHWLPVMSDKFAHSADGSIRNDFGLDLAVIGNGRTAALLEPASRFVWWCYPRFDGDPVFSRLLAGDEEKGFCDIVLDGMVHYESQYERNTAVVSTILTDSQDASVKITDFAPRFRNFDQIFSPPQLIRIIEPLSGLPRITVRMRPTSEYGVRSPTARSGAITSLIGAEMW